MNAQAIIVVGAALVAWLLFMAYEAIAPIFHLPVF